MTKITFLLLLSLFILHFSCGTSKSLSTEVKTAVTIHLSSSAQENELFLFKIVFEKRVDSIILDDQGRGEITLDIDRPMFAFLINEKSNKPFKLIVNPGFNLTMNIENDTVKFSGSGAEANNTLTNLFKTETEMEQFVMTKKGEKWSNCEAILDARVELDSILKKAFTKLLLSNKSDHVSNLLKLESYAFIDYLFINEIMDLSFEEETILSYEELDRLKLQQILGSDQLLRSSSHNIIRFLLSYNDILLRQVWLHENKQIHEVESSAINKIITSHKIARSNKDFLVYWNIHMSIFHFGLTNEVFELIDLYNTTFENPIYMDKIQNLIETTNELQQGQEAFDFYFIDFEGRMLNLEDFKGQFIFIDVWASWCGPCVKNIPIVHDVMKQFPEVKLVFLNTEDEVIWRKFLEKFTTTELSHHFRNASSDFNLKYKITSLPRYILIDKNGKIVNAFVVFNDKNTLLDYLNVILKS